MANTFAPGDDLFSFADDNFVLVKREVGNAISSACAKTGAGEYIPDTEQTYDERQEVTLTYRANKKTSALTVAVSLGLADTVSTYVPTSVKVNTGNTKHAEVQIVGHKHGAGTHEVNSVDVSCSVDGWGATDFCSDTANDGCQSSSWTATIDHVDKLTKAGAFLCGRSQGCRIDCTAEIVADAAPALDGDLTDDGSQVVEGEDFYTASLKGHKFAVPA